MNSCAYYPISSSNKIVRKITVEEHPVIYARQDQDCDASRALGNFSSHVKVWLAGKDGELVQEAFDLADISLNGLNSEFISSTVFIPDEVNRRDFLNSVGAAPGFSDFQALNALDDKIDSTQYQNIYFCRPEGGYQRDSLENVALSALVGIKQAFATHRAVATGKKKSSIYKDLEKIQLVIHPKLFAFEERNEKNSIVKKYYVDNGFWTILPSGKKIIAVLPHSEEMEEQSRLKFWEQPAIFAHEYGHHIFNSYAPSVLERASSVFASAAEARVVQGFNEGIADLIAYWSMFLDKQFYSMMHFGYTDAGYRDIGNDSIRYYHLDVNIKKIFDEQLVAEMTHACSHQKSHFLDQNLYFEKYLRQEPHHTGAVVAFTFNKIATASGCEHELKKFENLILWLDTWEKLYKNKKLPDGKAYLEQGLLSWITLFKKTFHDYSLEERNDLDNEFWLTEIRQLFPIYEKKWFEEGHFS